MFAETGCDAVMIGRAALGNPWIFRETRQYLDTGTSPLSAGLTERIDVLLEHLRDASQQKGETRAVIEMRKHYRGYLRGLSGAARLRAALMVPLTLAAVEAVLATYARSLAAGGGPPAFVREDIDDAASDRG
jgi:tRNA-dihydrouridine synthase B